jgi:hypothetical protein
MKLEKRRSGLLERSIVIAALALSSSAGPADAATNLLTNGSFESGNFTGWTVLNSNPLPDGAAVITISDRGVVPEDGTYQAAFPAATGPQIAQTFADTAGATLEVTVWYAASSPTDALDFLIGGTRHQIPIGITGVYQQFHFFAPATGSDTLQVDSSASVDEPNLVDNLSVVQFVGAPAAPEASTWAMMLVGFASLGLMAARSGRANFWRLTRVYREAWNS